jgi:2-aminobenzoate-CoA ligase
MVKELQDFVKQAVAPYTHPRAVTFVDSLQRTQTGKLQRFNLHELSAYEPNAEREAAR